MDHQSLIDSLWRSIVVLLATAVSAYLAWRLLRPLLPLLFILAGLTLLFRLIVGTARQRRRW
jgi:Flp pilus assembly protein TadB